MARDACHPPAAPLQLKQPTLKGIASTQHRRPPVICLHGWLRLRQLWQSPAGGNCTPLAVRPPIAGFLSAAPTRGLQPSLAATAAWVPSTAWNSRQQKADRVVGHSLGGRPWRLHALPCLGYHLLGVIADRRRGRGHQHGPLRPAAAGGAALFAPGQAALARLAGTASIRSPPRSLIAVPPGAAGPCSTAGAGRYAKIPGLHRRPSGAEPLGLRAAGKTR